MEIVLASQSPRRRELLERLGVKNFRIVTPDIDEHMERELPPEELVRRISAEKARAVREQAGMDAVVIAADTVVALDGAVLGKPADELEAFKMLSTLSGCRHQVYTGMTVLRGEGAYSGSEKRVLMCAFKQKEIVTLKEMIFEIDKNAFIIVCNAHEVTGNGFKTYRKDAV